MIPLRGKGISTALATIAIISVLVISMVWMSYMLALNARQQAQMAGQAETAALKAKELVRVYIWLDPAKRGNTYLNLTRISFVNEWSGETTINGLLIVYRDQPAELKQVSIKLAAGEEKTYLPSELGIPGIDNYQAALSRLRYVQAHTTLGNDFVSLWGRPDNPALYVTGTTRTDTYTETTTTTSITVTTTTRTTTTTSYTTTWRTTTTRPPPPGVPMLTWQILENYCTFLSVRFSFNPNGWGTPPYTITGQWSAYNRWGSRLASGGFGPYTTSGAYSWTVGMSALPDPQSYGWTIRVVDSAGRVAVWKGGMGVGCDYQPPRTTSGPTPPGPTTLPPTTQPPGATTITMTETVTQTTFLSAGSTVTVTVTGVTTSYVTVTSTITSTYVGNTYVTITRLRICTQTIQNTLNKYGILPTYVSVLLPCYEDIPTYLVPVHATEQDVERWGDVGGPPVYSLVLLGLLLSPELMQHKRRKKLWITLVLVLSAATLFTATVNRAQAEVYYTTVTVTTTVTYSYTNTYTYTYTYWITYTGTWTTYTVTWTYSTITMTSTVVFCTSTVTVNSNVCRCGIPPGCVFNCPWPQE
jgi:hypothetical protein